MRFRVQFTDEATSTVNAIFRWIADRSPDGAQRWKAALEEAVIRISDAADTFAFAAESDAFSEPLREVLFKTRSGRRFRAIFVVRDETVTVISVRGSHQNLIDPDDVELPE